MVILFLGSVCSNIFSQDMWTKQISPTNKNLYRSTFPDSNNGWAAGDSGTIINTTNGGFTWNIQYSGLNYNVDDIFFINKRLGWGIHNYYGGWGSQILYTTNSGINWNHYDYPDTSLFLMTIKFIDSLNGYMGGYWGTILKTTDSGFNWTRMSVDTSQVSQFPVRKISVFSDKFLFACGGAFDISGVIWRSTNYGNFWLSQPISFEPLYDIAFIDSLNLIGVGGDYEYGTSITRSSDGGLNWEYISLNYFGIGYSIGFRTSDEIWIPLSFSASWMLSHDKGYNWQVINTTDSSAVYDVKFTDSLHGFAVGDKGVILKYNSSLIGISNYSNAVSSYFNLYQNYPNPFNPNTTIKYYLSKPSLVRLTIYDFNGREVKNILNSFQYSGEHNTEINVNSFASGVYFYRLETNFGNMTKKMVIIK